MSRTNLITPIINEKGGSRLNKARKGYLGRVYDYHTYAIRNTSHILNIDGLHTYSAAEGERVHTHMIESRSKKIATKNRGWE